METISPVSFSGGGDDGGGGGRGGRDDGRVPDGSGGGDSADGSFAAFAFQSIRFDKFGNVVAVVEPVLLDDGIGRGLGLGCKVAALSYSCTKCFGRPLAGSHELWDSS